MATLGLGENKRRLGTARPASVCRSIRLILLRLFPCNRNNVEGYRMTLEEARERISDVFRQVEGRDPGDVSILLVQMIGKPPAWAAFPD